MKKLPFVLVGLVSGYVAYVFAMVAVEYAIYGRVDTEKAFYALFSPFELPVIIVPSNWKYVRPEEILLSLLGAALLVAGVVFVFWFTKPSD